MENKKKAVPLTSFAQGARSAECSVGRILFQGSLPFLQQRRGQLIWKVGMCWLHCHCKLLPVDRSALTHCFGQFHSWGRKFGCSDISVQSPGGQGFAERGAQHLLSSEGGGLPLSMRVRGSRAPPSQTLGSLGCQALLAFPPGPESSPSCSQSFAHY